MHQQETWPALPLAEWQETYTTLHMYSQVVGKVRLESSPMINHWGRCRSTSPHVA
jgi:Family of unknown function (DUF5996)